MSDDLYLYQDGYAAGWADCHEKAVTPLVNKRTREYENQTFEEARRLMANTATERQFLMFRNCGILRNDAEIAAFDAWEQRNV